MKLSDIHDSQGTIHHNDGMIFRGKFLTYLIRMNELYKVRSRILIMFAAKAGRIFVSISTSVSSIII